MININKFQVISSHLTLFGLVGNRFETPNFSYTYLRDISKTLC